MFADNSICPFPELITGEATCFAITCLSKEPSPDGSLKDHLYLFTVDIFHGSTCHSIENVTSRAVLPMRVGIK